ncbi:hypothetical protein L6R29_13525 [Myxococcota bacterium]|nr:hypothetical protein [Myxococcota bacterium]
MFGKSNTTQGQVIRMWAGHAARAARVAYVAQWAFVGWALQGCVPTNTVRAVQTQDTSVMTISRYQGDAEAASSLRFGPYQVREVRRNASPISSLDEESGESRDVGHYQGYAFRLEGREAPVVGACTAEFRQDQQKQAFECELAGRTNKRWQMRLQGATPEGLSGAVADERTTMQIVKEHLAQATVPQAIQKADYYILKQGRLVGALHRQQSIVWIRPNLTPHERELVASATAALLLLQKAPSTR